MHGAEKRLLVEGYDSDVIDVILGSRRKSTIKQYQSHILDWERFCATNGYDSVNISVKRVLKFLHTVFAKG